MPGATREPARVRESVSVKAPDEELDPMTGSHLDLELVPLPAVDPELHAGGYGRDGAAALEADDVDALVAEDVGGDEQIAFFSEAERTARADLLAGEDVATSRVRPGEHGLDDVGPSALPGSPLGLELLDLTRRRPDPVHPVHRTYLLLAAHAPHRSLVARAARVLAGQGALVRGAGCPGCVACRVVHPC